MKSGGNVVRDFTYDIEQWVERPRMGEREKSDRSNPPRRRRCKWAGSREIIDPSGECRPIMSLEDWGF